jgi:prepilin-type processing-associated H-X9-DG protein
MKGWAGTAFSFPDSRADLLDNPDKGALWPWIKDVNVYRCARGRKGHALTYATVVSANGVVVEGTYIPSSGGRELKNLGKPVGSTVLKLTKLTDIISPGAAQRAIFVDIGQTPAANDFYVHYLYPKWRVQSPPPKHHSGGVTLSMADGHAEYWTWKGRETVEMPCKVVPVRSLYNEVLEGGDYEPQTEEGLYDLQRLQRVTWGRLGY